MLFRSKHIAQFSALSQSELGKLYAVDEYPSEKFVFSAFGYVLYLREEMVADAFSGLPEPEQTILILYCVLELPDKEVGNFVGMSRSAVQRHRTKASNKLRKTWKTKEYEIDMKQATFNGRVLLPMDVIKAARAGDPLALERVLRYYDRYINKICTRTLYDKDGLPHIGIDEYMKHRLQAKLVEAIVVKK